MNRRVHVLLAVFVLSACGGATARTSPTPVDAPTVDFGPASPSFYDGGPSLYKSELVLATAAHNIDGWDARARAEAEEAARVLQVNCPYNRAAFQLPVALHRVVSQVDGRGLDPATRAELERAKQGLAHHVAVLDTITGGEWAQPGVADYLDRLSPEATFTRAELDAAADPLVPMMAALEQIQPLVDAYDDATYARIEAANTVLIEKTGEAWELKYALMGFRNTFQAVAPQLTDPLERTRMEAVLAAMEVFISNRC